MPPIHILIKPASSSCNMRCQYCFYYDVSEHRQTFNYGHMSIGTLEAIVAKAMDYAEGQCSFAFQGGEPTWVGLESYKAVIRPQEKYSNPNLVGYNSI